MMKPNPTIRVLAVAAGVLLPATAAAQNSYLVSQYSAPYVPVGAGTLANFAQLDDDVLQLPIGFSFSYFGVNYTHVNVSTNGALVFAETCQTILDCPFGLNNLCVSGRCLVDPGISAPSAGMPAPGDPNQVIGLWWDDLHLQGGGVRYATLGTAPNRTFVVQYENVLHYPASTLSRANFQVFLEENTGTISMHYGPYIANANGDAEWSGTMGIEDEVGTEGFIGAACANAAPNYCPYTTLQSLTDQVIQFVVPNGPELVVRGTAPTGGSPGGPISIDVVAENLGPATTGSAFTADVYFSTDGVIEATDTLLGSVSFPNLGAQSSATQTLAANVPTVAPGFYSIGAIVDPSNAVMESVETNNAGRFTDRFLVGSDFSIAVTAPATGGPGTTVTVPVQIVNLGAANPSVAYDLFFSSDTTFDAADLFIGSATVSVPAQPQTDYTLNVVIPTNVMGGNFYVVAVVDPGNRITEADEMNNIGVSGTTTEIRLADIVAVDVELLDIFAFRGQAVMVRATIDNQGGADANGFHYAFHLSENQLISALSDPLLAEIGPVNLAGGDTVTVTHTVQVPTTINAGPYYLGLITNTLSSVDEDNPNNNITRTMATIEVRDPAPDFTVENLRTQSMGAAGESMPIARLLVNRGNAGGATGYEVYLSEDRDIDTVSDVFLGAFTASVAAGQGDETVDIVSVPVGVVSGDYYVGYIVDPALAVDELFEDNNVTVSDGTIGILGSPLQILTREVPLGTLSVSYDMVFAARGGNGAYVWSIESGQLPTGLTLESNGRLHGTPEVEGLFPITVRVSEGALYRDKTFNLLIAPTNAPLEIVTRALPPAFVGRTYSYPLTAFGGTRPYVWTEVSPDDLPAGLTLSPDGIIMGTPTVPVLATLNFRVTDATGSFAEFPLSLRVVTSIDTVRFSAELLPDGRLGDLYDETLRVEMGSGVSPFTFSVIAGALPDGLDHERGRISGTPLLVGDFSFTMRVEDARGDFDVNRFVVQISEQGGVSFSTVALPIGYVDEPYLDEVGDTAVIQAVTLDAAGRPHLSIVSGTLPPGLTMTEDGAISGTPSSAGVFSFVVFAEDDVGQSAVRAYGISIDQRDKPPGSTDDGCGCTSTNTSSSGWLWLFIAAFGLLRIRRVGLVAVVLTMLASSAQAQSYQTENVAGTYMPRVGTTMAFPGFFLDDEEVLVNLPFAFRFYSNDYSQVRVGTNGFVSFGPDATEYENTPLPNIGTPNDLIALFWDDAAAPDFEFVVEGAAPNRVAIIQYATATRHGNAQSGRPQVQLHLYEGASGRFEIHYGGVTNMSDPLAWTATIGFEDTAGANGETFLACSPACTGNDIAALENRILRATKDGGTELIAAGVDVPSLVYEGVAFNADVHIRSVHLNPLGPFVYQLHLLAAGQTMPGNLVFTSGPTTVPPFTTETVVANVAIPLNTPAGRYRLLAVIDSTDVIVEPDESNNTVISSTDFSIAPRRPDFAVVGVSSTPTRAAPGDAIDVDLVLTNRGNLDGTTDWRLVLSRNQVISTDDTTLANGTVTLSLLSTATVAQRVTLPSNLVAGDYFLGVIADADNAVPEIDEVNNAAAATQGLTVVVDGLTVATTALPNAFVQIEYSAYLFATGGDGSYTWSVDSGALPDGLTLVPSTGEILGRATTVTDATFVVRVDSAGASATQSLTLSAVSVQSGLAIVSDNLLPAIVGAAYPPAPPDATPDQLQRIAAVGGTGSYNFRLVSAPPPGLELDPSGLLSGVAQQAGVYQLEVEVDDGDDLVTKQIPLTVAEPGRLTLVSTVLPAGRIGEEYAFQLRVIGKAATATVTYTTGGPLPDGIVLSPEGRLVGIPQTVGTRHFVVVATEGTSSAATQDTASFRLTIDNAGGFSITPTSIPVGMVGQEYEVQLTTRGGNGPYAWRLLGPALHRGVTWSVNAGAGADTMTIAGIPEVHGLVSVLATVTDSQGRFAREAFTLVVDTRAPAVAPPAEGCTCVRVDRAPPHLVGLLFGLVLFVRRRRTR